MTLVERIAREKYGSLRKMMLENGMKPGTVYVCLNGNRKPWPAVRRRIAEALGVSESEIFHSDGWPKEAAANDQ